MACCGGIWNVAAAAGVALLVSGTPAGTKERQPYMAASSDHGGIVRFDGTLLGDVFVTAQRHCNANAMDAVPLGFFRVGPHPDGGGETLMTFQCVPALRDRLR